MTRLIYLGGSTLTFGTESGGRRTVSYGEQFEVGDELAEVLLADPHVSTPEEVGTMFTAEAVASPVVKPHSTSGLDAIKALRARAKELGIPATGKAPELAAAIAAAEKRPTVIPTVAADTPPAPGAITLGYLPPSAKIGGS